MVVFLVRRERVGLLQLPLVVRNRRKVSVSVDSGMDLCDIEAIYQG